MGSSPTLGTNNYNNKAQCNASDPIAKRVALHDGESGIRLSEVRVLSACVRQRRRSQVVKAGVCKTSIRRFDSARRLQQRQGAQERVSESRRRSSAIASRISLFADSIVAISSSGVRVSSSTTRLGFTAFRL